ncbi:MICOS complex subunit Mic60-like [Neocloeon triangulifer]|uniref:MICOS complex subunit Mic60-like n=1 Tax=Neocloeon triangulifer TaxID=2078957 RepID=UPI00286ECD11|nr:MICOS complex subunit Mic60-like [Neocloeon triangulifer]
MLRTTVKGSLGRLGRMCSPRRAALPQKEIRAHQSTKAGGGGGSAKIWVPITALTAATVGTAIYAKYDPSFRRLLEDNVPYADSVISSTSSVIDTTTGLIDSASGVVDSAKSLVSSAQEKASGLFGGASEDKPKAPSPPPAPKETPKPKEAKEPAPVVKKEEVKPAPKPATPSADESLLKKKLERDAQNAALSGLIKLQATVDAACAAATSTSANAINQIKSLGAEFSNYSADEPSERLIASLISKNTEAEIVTKKAFDSAGEAQAKLASLKTAVANSTVTGEGLKSIQESIAKVEKQLKEADEALFKAQEAIKPSEALSSQISSAYHKLQQELGPNWDPKKKDDQDLFVLLISLRMLHYKEQLNKQSKQDERALIDTLKAAGEEGVEERVQEHLKVKEEELRRQLNEEYHAQIIQVRDEAERRAQSQLRQQAMIMTDDKNAALLSQRSAFSRELSDRIGHMVQQHTQQIGSAVEALHKADKNIKKREEAVLHGAKLLAISRSCDNLMRSLGINPYPTKDWTHQRRGIDGHVRDVKKVFEGQKDDFVEATLKMLPEKGVKIGVLTEPALKARFNDVERVARKVSMIHRDDQVPLTWYLLSFLRSTVLLQPHSSIKPSELNNDPTDLSTLDNNALLDRARYFVDQGDLLQAARYANLLRGPCRHVVSGWLDETTTLLEVKNVAQTLAAYASLLVQKQVIQPELSAPKA